MFRAQSFLYQFLCMMNDQPIIIEEPCNGHPSERKKANQDQLRFFELLDEVENYDSIATCIRQKYREAMLGVAAVRFNSPHSINLSAQKCLPAFLKISPEGKLVYEYSSFSNPVPEEDVYADEFEQQEKNEQVCLQKQQKLISCENINNKEQMCENELLWRFNVANQQEKILQISRQFKEVIQLLLQLQQRRNSFESYIEKTEGKDQ